jgi:integrase/recombinase XerD
MARYRAPLTVGLPFEQWPSSHQRAWLEATREGDILTDGGRAVRWKPQTHKLVARAVGNFLRFGRDRGELQDGQTVAQLLTESTLRDYIAVLRRRLAPRSVVTQLGHLSLAISVMAPEVDRTLIKLAVARLTRTAAPSREKGGRLASPVVLLELGQKLMVDWQVRRAHDPRLNAMDYRDGLMIAFLALCPVRVDNLAHMEIGRHVHFDGEIARVTFAAQEMKGGRSLEFDWPDTLRPALDYYLRQVHPMLYNLPQIGAPLWPSLHRCKRQMGASGIYTRIMQVTAKHLGRSINPHMFRDAAATFIAETTPERALLAAGVLQHRNLQITKNHYIRGQQHQMLHRYQDAIGTLIADVMTEPRDLREE